MNSFEKAFERTIGHEGSYVWNSQDPGGETKYGISRRSYPRENISEMTIERARVIYERDFWVAAKCDEMPDKLAAEVFDAAVNSGIAQASRWLQRSLGVADDGIIGPVTLSAARACAVDATVARFLGWRLAFMADLSTWPSFGRGWARRVAGNLRDVGV
jgi:lysozyme family protein